MYRQSVCIFLPVEDTYTYLQLLSVTERPQAWPPSTRFEYGKKQSRQVKVLISKSYNFIRTASQLQGNGGLSYRELVSSSLGKEMQMVGPDVEQHCRQSKDGSCSAANHTNYKYRCLAFSKYRVPCSLPTEWCSLRLRHKSKPFCWRKTRHLIRDRNLSFGNVPGPYAGAIILPNRRIGFV